MCVHVCVHACVGTYIMCAHGSLMSTSSIITPEPSSLFLETGSFSEPRVHLFGYTVELVSPGKPPVPVPSVLGIQACAATSGFLCKWWGLNLGPCGWTASTLPAEIFPALLDDSYTH